MQYQANSPIYMDFNAFRSSVVFEQPQQLQSHGGIYRKDPYLFIVYPEKGIHVFDNSNPSSPVNLGFLKIMGCTGMEIRDEFLVANSFTDLVVIDISTISSPVEVARINNVFPQALPTRENNLPVSIIDKEKGVVVGWKIETIKEDVSSQPNWINCINCEGVNFAQTNSSSSSSPSTGLSGSITKFTQIGNFIYVMDGHRLIPFDFSSITNPSFHGGVWVNRVVETLFAYNNHIFMGTTTGMLIYGTNSPSVPNYVSEVNHLLACDPVVVQDDIAYVTIRSGRDCGGEINQLDVVNVSNFSNPFIEASYNMTNPHGLGIDGDLLFICDGADGLKVFDATIPEMAGATLLHTFSNVIAVDIIPHEKLAILIGENALQQYDYSNPQNFNLLSTIPIFQ